MKRVLFGMVVLFMVSVAAGCGTGVTHESQSSAYQTQIKSQSPSAAPSPTLAEPSPTIWEAASITAVPTADIINYIPLKEATIKDFIKMYNYAVGDEVLDASNNDSYYYHCFGDLGGIELRVSVSEKTNYINRIELESDSGFETYMDNLIKILVLGDKSKIPDIKTDLGYVDDHYDYNNSLDYGIYGGWKLVRDFDVNNYRFSIISMSDPPENENAY